MIDQVRVHRPYVSFAVVVVGVVIGVVVVVVVVVAVVSFISKPGNNIMKYEMDNGLL